VSTWCCQDWLKRLQCFCRHAFFVIVDFTQAITEKCKPFLGKNCNKNKNQSHFLQNWTFVMGAGGVWVLVMLFHGSGSVCPMTASTAILQEIL